MGDTPDNDDKNDDCTIKHSVTMEELGNTPKNDNCEEELALKKAADIISGIHELETPPRSNVDILPSVNKIKILTSECIFKSLNIGINKYDRSKELVNLASYLTTELMFKLVHISDISSDQPNTKSNFTLPLFDSDEVAAKNYESIIERTIRESAVKISTEWLEFYYNVASSKNNVLIDQFNLGGPLSHNVKPNSYTIHFESWCQALATVFGEQLEKRGITAGKHFLDKLTSYQRYSETTEKPHNNLPFSLNLKGINVTKKSPGFKILYAAFNTLSKQNKAYWSVDDCYNHLLKYYLMVFEKISPNVKLSWEDLILSLLSKTPFETFITLQ